MAADSIRALRPALIAASVMLGLSLGMAGFAWQRESDRRDTRADRERLATASFHALQRMRGELADARSHDQRYRALVGSGVVGPWDKLDTVDRLDAALRRWPGVISDYVVARTLGPFPAGVDGPEGHLYREVTATLNLRPRHELELVDVINAALGAGPQRGDVTACDIRRGENDGGLRANCTLAWHGFERDPTVVAGATDPAAPATAGAPEVVARGSGMARPGPRASVRKPVLDPPAPRLALGPLFFTPAQRNQADRGPEPAPAAPVAIAAGDVDAGVTDRRVQGYVRRSDGDDVVWVGSQPLVLERPGDLDESTLQLAPASRTRPLVDADALPPRPTRPGVVPPTVR